MGLNAINRRLSEGLSSWLQFEFNCQRGELFSEKYLSTPIGQILSSEFGSRVHSEYTHPILKRARVDFAVTNTVNERNKEKDRITLAIESKWTSRSLIKAEDILWDLIRLELLSAHYNTECYFILSGKSSHIKQLFKSESFSKFRGIGPLLNTGEGTSKTKLRLDNPTHSIMLSLSKRFSIYADIEFPEVISYESPIISPLQCRGMAFQTYVWKVVASKNRRNPFKPRNHKLYNKLIGKE